MHQRQQGGTCQRTTHTAYLTECCKHATAGVRLSRVIACQFSVVFETEYVNDFSLGCQKWKHTSLSATSTVISVSVLYTNSYCTFLTKQLFIVDSAYSIPSTMDSSSPSRIRTFSLRMTTQWRHSLQRYRHDSMWSIMCSKRDVFHKTWTYLGQLSLASLRGRLIEYQLRLG